MTHPLTHPSGRLPIITASDPIPDGHGAIAVSNSATSRAQRSTFPAQIGVDGAPALCGWGEALIVVPAGEHLVEAQFLRPLDALGVTVPPGAVVPVEFRTTGLETGQFVPSDGQLPQSPRGSLLGRLARRARLESESPLRRLRRGESVPAGSGLVLDLTFDLGVVEEDTDSSFAEGPDYSWWAEPPAVRVDATTLMLGWGRWWVPLPAGAHEVVVRLPVHAAGRVELAPGEAVTLSYRADLLLHRGTGTWSLSDRSTATVGAS